MDGTQHQRCTVAGSASHSYQVGSQDSNSSGQIPESCIYPMCYGPSCIVLLAYFCPVFLSSKHEWYSWGYIYHLVLKYHFCFFYCSYSWYIKHVSCSGQFDRHLLETNHVPCREVDTSPTSWSHFNRGFWKIEVPPVMGYCVGIKASPVCSKITLWSCEYGEGWVRSVFLR